MDFASDGKVSQFEIKSIRTRKVLIGEKESKSSIVLNDRGQRDRFYRPFILIIFVLPTPTSINYQTKTTNEIIFKYGSSLMKIFMPL